MLDRPEEIVSRKRTARWSTDDREWLDSLPESEREHVLLAAAHLGAEPCDAYEPTDPKSDGYHDRMADLADARD